MNTDQIKGDWKQLKGKVKEQWGKLTDDDLTIINGRRERDFWANFQGAAPLCERASRTRDRASTVDLGVAAKRMIPEGGRRVGPSYHTLRPLFRSLP